MPPLLRALALAVALLAAAAAAADPGSAGGDAVFEQAVVFPPHATAEEDAYLCTAIALPDRPLKLVGIEPTSDQRIVHHMLLFGCAAPAESATVWNCRMKPVCGTASESVLYGWGKNAPATLMPRGAGFSVGPGTGIRTLVLQMHYLHGRPQNDTSGIRLRLSAAPVPFSGGMVAFAASFSIPPRTRSTLVKNACCYAGWEPLHGFAARAHTHALGREVTLDRVHPGARAALERAVALDPQKPQGFYPIQPEATFLPGDQLAMACNFDSSRMARGVVAGHTASDEMCNIYLMLYSQLPYFMWCLDSHPVAELFGPGGLPPKGKLVPETTVWQPPSVIKRVRATSFGVGQVPGVASRGDGTLWAFHRGTRAWNPDGSVANAGGSGAAGGMEEEAVLQGPVVMQLDQDSGAMLRAWGSGTFIMPHMITPDYEGNLWVTDVALHQALKFSAEGEQLLALGRAQQPGHGPGAFCKPTQVAVARSGAVYVSDGYCNSRVAEFTANGTWVRDFTVPEGKGPPMLVPHSVVVHECLQRLIVAERERGRVHAFQLGSGEYLGVWDLQSRFGMPFALALGPYGSVLALTWDHTATPAQSRLVALGEAPGAVLGSWELPGLQFPHDLALAPAPLEVTGAGERLLAVVVSETKDTGQNLHKFVFTPPEGLLGGAGASAGSAAAGSSGAAGQEPLTAAELEEQEAVAAAKAAAAGHFGGTHAHKPGPGDDLEEEQQQQGDAAAAIGHRPVKPVDGSSGSASEPPGGTTDAEEATVGHGLVKPVEEAEAAQEAPQAGPQAQPAAAASGAAGEEQAQHAGHGMVRPVADPRQQQEGEEEEWEAMVGAAEQQQKQQQPPQDAPGVFDEEGGGEEPRPTQQQPGQQQAQQQRAAEQRAQEAAAEAADVEAESWRPGDGHSHTIGRSLPGVQPALLGVIFVAAALVSWSRLQHWRGRGGAGYQPAAGAQAPAEAQFGGQGHLADHLEHRGGGPNGGSPREHV